MFGNALDHLQHRTNALDFGTEAFDTLAGRFGCARQFFDPLHALAHHLLACANLVVCRLGRLRSLFGVTRDIMNSGSHLLHGGGDLLGFLLLATDLTGSLLGHRRE
ncbi:hypothetical protein D3C81_1008340 [compost metagenome]